jgi:PAS domain S-box-containing protein
MNLAAKLITIFLVLSIVPLSIVGYLAFDNGRQAIEQDMIDRLLTTTLLKKSEFVQWLDDSRNDVRVLASQPGVQQYATVLVSQDPASPEYQTAYYGIKQDRFLPFLQEQDNFTDFSLIRIRDGLILVSTREGLEGKYRESEPFFIEGQKDTYVENITYSATLGEQVMHISTPVKDENGSVVAVLAGYLNLADISAIMTQRGGLRETEETYLVNTFNFLVTESRFEANSSLRRAVYTEGVNDCLAGHDGSGFYNDYRDVPVIGTYRWIPEHAMCIVTEIDQSEAFQPIVDLRNSILLVGIAITLGVMGVGVVFTRTITGPVDRLVRGTEEIGKGNLGYRVGTGAKDEIGQLSRAFDQMVEALKTTTVSRNELAKEVTERKRAEEALRKLSARQSALLDAVPDIVVEVDDDKVYTWANQAGLEFFGEDVIGKEAAIYFVGEQDTYNVVNPLFGGAENVIYVESWQWRKDGQKRLLGWWCRVLKDENGAVTGALSSARDITERKQAENEIRRLNAELEQRVVERTAQLEASNKELEAFSYSVSHDLRAPLRAMDGFSRILLDEYATDLPGAAQRYLGLVHDNAGQMGNLIDHLLAFSRLGRQPLKKERVAPADIVQAALAGLSAAREGRDVEITFGDLPSCQADPALLRQVFANLLGNALKFTKTRNPAIIKVGCDNHTGEPVFFVKDNGVGFDMQYANKLFGVFQRLHRAEDYAGTGVGLATVQRIIHRHGGRIWAEAEVDKGATFYFTIEGGDSK